MYNYVGLNQFISIYISNYILSLQVTSLYIYI